MKLRGALIALFFVVSPAVAVAQTQGGLDPAQVERGRQTYNRVGCYQCHGYVAQGGLAGPRLAPNPMPAPLIAHYIRNPTGAMPPYAERVLDDAAVADIRAYLASIAPSPRVEDIPLLRDE